jgi:hypothetical protein
MELWKSRPQHNTAAPNGRKADLTRGGCAAGGNSLTTIYDTCHSPPFFFRGNFAPNFPSRRRRTEWPGIARNAKEKEKRRKETHSGRIRYVVLHYTLILHVVDHSPLIGTYNEISELPVEKR